MHIYTTQYLLFPFEFHTGMEGFHTDKLPVWKAFKKTWLYPGL